MVTQSYTCKVNWPSKCQAWGHHWFPCEMTCEKWSQKFHTYDVSLPRSGIISMESLHSFLRRHFAGKPVMASQNAGCLLKCLNTPILPQNDLRSEGFDCHGVALTATLFHCTWPLSPPPYFRNSLSFEELYYHTVLLSCSTTLIFLFTYWH